MTSSCPEIVTDLEELHPADRDLYLPLPGGRHQLHPRLLAQDDRHAAEIAERDAKAAALEAQLRDRAADAAVREAFEAAGVEPRLAPLGQALFKRQVALEVFEDGEVRVSADYGHASVNSAVAGWLEIEAGGPYRPKRRRGVDSARLCARTCIPVEAPTSSSKEQLKNNIGFAVQGFDGPSVGCLQHQLVAMGYIWVSVAFGQVDYAMFPHDAQNRLIIVDNECLGTAKCGSMILHDLRNP